MKPLPVPGRMPFSPNYFYKCKGWKGWNDLLGTVPAHHWTKEEVIADAQSYRHARQWQKENPKAYLAAWKKGWVKYATRHMKNMRERGARFMPFSEAREFARSLKFSEFRQWNKWSSTRARPKDIPTNPNYAYKNLGWKGYSDWLGMSERNK